MPTTHGQRKTRGYAAWASMLRRCYNPSQQNYSRYGGRGITVCPAWHKAAQFLLDMGQPPEGYSLDRIDGTRGYSPDNCRWATREQQNANRRHVQKLADQRIAAHVAKENGITIDAFHRRIHRGWPIDDAVSIPMGQRREVRS